ncbi:hypothetical protein [Yinghuangia seranimata]|uniref:hypothetical protein n=1 Tax=Yinghuangia seranimata TaxID=408067 RepID=UPI00248D1818|nr:hypothetical protein [Yinghuangia seranimata]MDI2125778.1 hypothetical protein [Yinghuangia seranimata]
MLVAPLLPFGSAAAAPAGDQPATGRPEFGIESLDMLKTRLDRTAIRLRESGTPVYGNWAVDVPLNRVVLHLSPATPPDVLDVFLAESGTDAADPSLVVAYDAPAEPTCLPEE